MEEIIRITDAELEVVVGMFTDTDSSVYTPCVQGKLKHALARQCCIPFCFRVNFPSSCASAM